MFKDFTYGLRFWARLLAMLIVLVFVGIEAAHADLCEQSLVTHASWVKWEVDFKQSPNLTQTRSALLSQATQPGFVSRIHSSIEQFRSELHASSRRWINKFTHATDGVEDVDVVIVGGVHATTISAMLAEQLRALANARRLPRIPRVLVINDGDEPNRFVGETFLLNSPNYIKSDDSGHADLYEFDGNPVPGSPLDAVTIHTGLSSDGSHNFAGREAEVYITPVPAANAAGWLKAPWTHLTYLYPQASWLGDATLLAHKYSTIPVLLGTRITAVERKKRNSPYVLRTNQGFSIRTPIVVMATGMGDERMPFSDPGSADAFQMARSRKVGGTVAEFLDWSRQPGFFQSLKDKKVLLVGGADGGNMLVQRLKGVDPRGAQYLRQAPADIAQSIDLTWSGQTAKDGKSYIALQARGGSFRIPIYQAVGGLFGQSGFHPTKTKAKRMSLLPDGRLHVKLTDGHEDDFDRVYSAAGYDDQSSELLETTDIETLQRRKIKSSESSNFGKSVIVAEGYSSSGTLLLDTGPSIASTLGYEGNVETDPAGEDTHAHGFRNLAFRAAEIPELIVKRLQKLGIVGP